MNNTSRVFRSRRSSLSVVALGAALGASVLAGCNGNGLQSTSASDPSVQKPSPSTGFPTAASSPSAAHATDTTPAPGSPTRPTTAEPAAKPTSAAHDGICALHQLHVGVRVPEGAGAAGSEYVLLTFRNTSTSRCVLDGHPGVSFVGKGDGTQLGDPAARPSSATRRVRLQPGDTTTALLRIANAGNYDPQRCAPTTADGFRVYPPDSRASAFVSFTTQACQRSLGADHQLSVSAVGLAKPHGSS